MRPAQPQHTIKELAVARAEASLRPWFERVLRSYERYAADMIAGGKPWEAFVERNVPPNPIRANSKIIGFDMFVDDSGLRMTFTPSGAIDEEATGLVPAVRELFERETGIDPTMCDFEKRDVDRYRVEIVGEGPLANQGFNYLRVQAAIMAVQCEVVSRGWMISETMLNRTFIDGEGDRLGKEVVGVSRPYAMNLGTNYSER